MKTVDSVKKEIVDLLKSTEREYIEKRILSLVLGLLLLANAISAQQGCGTVSDHEGNRRGICPEGWHIPSVAEWDTLVRYVSGQQEYLCNGYTAYIAKALASTEGWGIVPCDPNGIAEFLDPNTGTPIFLECNSAKWFVFLCTCRSDTSLLSRTKHFSTFKQ